MPELPEVETIARDLVSQIIGLNVEEVHVYDNRVISIPNSPQFKKSIEGLKVSDVKRRAKAVIISFDNGTFLVVHLRMTGQLIVEKTFHKIKETKVTFRLSNGFYLNYNDQRIFGRLSFVANLDDISYIKTSGPEPLNDEFTVSWLNQNLKKRTTPIKILLLNQNFVAGIGNIYASEILFAAKVSPMKRAGVLKKPEIEKIHRVTRSILTEAIKHRGCSMRNYLDSFGRKGNFMSRIKVYGRNGEACMSCKKPIVRIVQATRSTFYCKHCQK